MSKRPCIDALCLLVVLPVLMIGCGSGGRLPTAVSPRKDVVTAAPNPDARGEGTRGTMCGRRHRHLPPRAVIAEAKEALGAVLTGEQVYYQRWATFTDVPESAGLCATLGVCLGDAFRRWVFSVSDASVTGFLATAQGRRDTDAEGITVTLSYHRGEPVSWTVKRTRPGR